MPEVTVAVILSLPAVPSTETEARRFSSPLRTKECL